MSGRSTSTGRDETPEERADRKFSDLLQELRVMQTGVQLTAGFLLTLPLQERFEDLGDGQRYHYLALVLLAAITTCLVLGPVAAHRRLSGQQVKDRVVEAAHQTTKLVLACVALLAVGITAFLFDVVVDLTAALVAAGVVAVVAVVLLLVVPARLVDRDG